LKEWSDGETERRSEDSKIQRFKDSMIQGFKDSMIQSQVFDMRYQEWIKEY